MKKNFANGLDTLLGNSPTVDKNVASTSNKREISKTSQEGTKDNETRATFIVNEKLLEDVKNIAYWERKLIKDLVNEALEKIVTDYIKKNKTIEPRLKRN
jgi:hypothetical protein